MQIANTLLIAAIFISATTPIMGNEKIENAPLSSPMQYPQLGGKGPGMGHDYQKNTPGPGKGKPNYQGGQNGHADTESTTNSIKANKQLEKPAVNTLQKDIQIKNKPANQLNEDQKDANLGSQTSVPVKRQRGSGVGFPGYRGQGGTGYPQHRQFGSPPLKKLVQPSLPIESKSNSETNKSETIKSETNKPLSSNKSKPAATRKPTTDIRRALLHAAAFGDVASVKKLLKQGANPGARAKDRKARTALILAAAGGHLEIVNSLITNGAKVDEKDLTGHTALNWAAMRSHNDVASLLLKNGADINTKTNGDVSPLLYAVGTHNTELVKLLVENGVDMEVMSRENKMTPLLLAIEHKDIESVEILIKSGAKVSKENRLVIEKLRIENE